MPTTKQKQKEQLQKAGVLAIELARANTHLHFFRELHQAYRPPIKIKDFWDYTLTAHFGMTLSQICRAYDTRRDGINLLQVLGSVDKSGLNAQERQRLDVYLGNCG